MLIELKNVSHTYTGNNSTRALVDIDLTLTDHEFIGIIGHTGSGKSTLVQLFNGLITPTGGQVIIDGVNITGDSVNLQEVRRKIGLVFQYPEHQLFEETVFKDIAFGPRNLELREEEVTASVKKAMALVGLDYEKFRERSPFNLSGGQQRKVAIAGVLAMEPRVLILDEPSAGLDPRGRDQLLELLENLYYEQNMTVILISHRMDEIARLTDRVLVMAAGEIVLDGTPKQVFNRREKMRELGLDLPEITGILLELKKRGLAVRTDIFTVHEATREIIAELRSKNRC